MLSSMTRRQAVTWVVLFLSAGAVTVGALVRGAFRVDPPRREILLWVEPFKVTVWPDGTLCLDAAPSIPHGLWVKDRVVYGPLYELGDPRALPGGRIRIEGNHHTIVLTEGSSVAIVDGRSVALESDVKWEFVATGPLSRLGALLGYTFETGHYTRPGWAPDERADWIVRHPRGTTVPDVASAAREALTTDSAWVLIYSDSHEPPAFPECGTPSGLLGSLIDSADGPWVDAEGFTRDAGVTLTWNSDRGTGQVRYGRVAVEVELRPGGAGRGPAVRVGSRVYAVPGRLVERMQAGRLAFPVAPVARALGWQFRRLDVERRVARLSPP